MTIKELKEILKDWPESDAYGEPTEVWMDTGKNLSSPVSEVFPLNYRRDEETGVEWSDILFSTEKDW